MSSTDSTKAGVNWKQVGLFLGLTFGVSYLLDLLMYLKGGLSGAGAFELLQLRMLVPALVAIVLGMFVFKDSPFHVSRSMPDGRSDRARGFFYLFMAMTLVFIAIAVLAVAAPAEKTLIAILKQVALFGGVIGLLLLRLVGGRDSFARANLRGGRFVHWVLYGGAIVVFFGLQAALNQLFKLSTASDLRTLMPAGTTMPIALLTVVLGAQTVIVGSLIGLVVTLGEEYGWRGFLQGQLIRSGKRRGVLVLGIIWGVWHYPVIWMGYNYPGRPVIGTLLMTVFTVLFAYVLGYAVLKTGSVLLAAFMHAVFNQSAAFFLSLAYKPHDPIFSFGIGLYGLAILAVIVLLLLLDPIWKDSPTTGQVGPAASSDRHVHSV
ncbi:MAG TPA: CPBP family intramembrane glutamic endopeptidase [Spirochaetia bacterium]|nr:CPBP family intramembrane glutamic endopeptidase [Spirochaetia bacterium]